MNPIAARNRPNRVGAAAVEFALVVPIFLLLVFGIIEFGRVVMVQQILVNASREGARAAAVEGATQASVQKIVKDYLKGCSIKSGANDVVVSPDPSKAKSREEITVSIAVKFSDVSWMPPMIYDDNLSAATTMKSEKLD
ncbi:TadE-like protein [Rhodopirellula maiorica SM1]|uniref:TadE-like protein n=1 Tax=Rhodopirellula maiorica SM1 TaxID=1265738 RepID=M5RJS8_9BACT|nr:TadE-like protein [Rhodopirellula maiorica SM1]